MQMIVPGCEDCVGYNESILDAEATDSFDLAYDLEWELAHHNETHSAEEDARRVSWRVGLQMARA